MLQARLDTRLTAYAIIMSGQFGTCKIPGNKVLQICRRYAPVKWDLGLERIDIKEYLGIAR